MCPTLQQHGLQHTRLPYLCYLLEFAHSMSIESMMLSTHFCINYTSINSKRLAWETDFTAFSLDYKHCLLKTKALCTFQRPSVLLFRSLNSQNMIILRTYILSTSYDWLFGKWHRIFGDTDLTLALLLP